MEQDRVFPEPQRSVWPEGRVFDEHVVQGANEQNTTDDTGLDHTPERFDVAFDPTSDPFIDERRALSLGRFVTKCVPGIKRTGYYVKNAIETAAVALEISPANETARYAIFGWAHTATGGNLVASAAAFGLSTFIIEASAALMAADLLETRTSKKVVDKINDLSRRFINSDSSSKEMSLVSRAATAMVFGSAVLVAAKHRKDPERTKRANQISGLKTAATMGAYFTGEGLLTGEAVNNFGWPKTIVGGLAILAGAQHLIKKFADRRTEKK